MMAITTSNSISVNADRRDGWDMMFSQTTDEKGTTVFRTAETAEAGEIGGGVPGGAVVPGSRRRWARPTWKRAERAEKRASNFLIPFSCPGAAATHRTISIQQDMKRQ
jgi:hypothetical protein